MADLDCYEFLESESLGPVRCARPRDHQGMHEGLVWLDGRHVQLRWPVAFVIAGQPSDYDPNVDGLAPSIAQLGDLCQAINPAYDGLDRDMREFCRNRALSVMRKWSVETK